MNIHEYTERIRDNIKTNTNPDKIENGSDIFLSLIGLYIPKNSLVFLGGRPRSGKTSLILDFVTKNSLLSNPNGHSKLKKSPKKGLVYIIGHKEHIVLNRWCSIVTQSLIEFKESEQFRNYALANYTKAIEGATIDLNFRENSEKLLLTIEKEIASYNPDYIVIDGLTIPNALNSSEVVEHLDKLIALQKITEKFFLISSNLGHDAFHRGGACRHYLEDFNSLQIESGADIVLMLHRPDLYGIDCDEEGYSMKGVVEIDVGINRYGNEGETIHWHAIHEIPKTGRLRAMLS